MQAGVLVLAGESKKKGVRGLRACTWSCQFLLVGSNRMLVV